MIDENKYYVTKSKLAITIKTVNIYNDKSMVAAKETKKQMTQRRRNWQKFRQKNKKTYLHTHTEM